MLKKIFHASIDYAKYFIITPKKSAIVTWVQQLIKKHGNFKTRKTRQPLIVTVVIRTGVSYMRITEQKRVFISVPNDKK